MKLNIKKIFKFICFILSIIVFSYSVNKILVSSLDEFDFELHSMFILIIIFFSSFVLFMVGGIITSIIHFICKKFEFKIDKFERYIKVLSKDHYQIIIDKNINKKIDSKIIGSNYFRDMPCDGNIFFIYYIALQYYLCDKEILQKGLIGALLLKWYDCKNIDIIIENNVFKNEIFMFNSNPKFDNKLEEKLFNILKISAKDNLLQKDEFEKWCNKNYLKIIIWLNEVEFEVVNNLIDKNYIKITKIYRNHKNAIFSKELYDIALQISGLKNYLNDFTNIKNKNSIDIKLMKNYLMCAYLFGIANKIKMEFIDLFPEGIQMINFDLPITNYIDRTLNAIFRSKPDERT